MIAQTSAGERSAAELKDRSRPVQRPQTARSVVLASVNMTLKERLQRSLVGMRWQVHETAGGAEALALLETMRPEALLLDSWLPDLEVVELAGQVRLMYPAVDLIQLDGDLEGGGTRSPRRNELLHAMREAQEGVPDQDEIALAGTASLPGRAGAPGTVMAAPRAIVQDANPRVSSGRMTHDMDARAEPVSSGERPPRATGKAPDDAVLIPEMVGRSAPMRELARLVRLVAPRSATVLIEGETGTGKEVVAKAVHRLSARAGKSFTVLNCAAIPETLLEAELFGHARGAFTGAVQSRTGRIEAAHGGTLFLDEIGEMPLALQAKMLRFLECGELQRVGDNETVRVDVRVITATHQPLEQRATERLFRLDLYHRLAVFPVMVPALRDRMDDLPLLVEFFLEQMGHDRPRKRISAAALKTLCGHEWPGNVRELMHVLERGAILADDQPEIGVEEIRLRRHASN